MYHFFTNACGDIAHYNIDCFKEYYNYSIQNLEKELLSKDTYIPSWQTDLNLIFKELKIGKYYLERDNINAIESSQYNNYEFDLDVEY